MSGGGRNRDARQFHAGDGTAPAPHPDGDASGPCFGPEDVPRGEEHSPAVIRAVRIEHGRIVRLDKHPDEWQDCP